jgi:hypothetical protein
MKQTEYVFINMHTINNIYEEVFLNNIYVTQVPPRFCQGKNLTNRKEYCEGVWNGMWGWRKR